MPVLVVLDLEGSQICIHFDTKLTFEILRYSPRVRTGAASAIPERPGGEDLAGLIDDPDLGRRSPAAVPEDRIAVFLPGLPVDGQADEDLPTPPRDLRFHPQRGADVDRRGLAADDGNSAELSPGPPALQLPGLAVSFLGDRQLGWSIGARADLARLRARPQRHASGQAPAQFQFHAWTRNPDTARSL